MTEAMLIILGMLIVTYIPRLIPFILIADKEVPPKIKQFLEYVPYAALGALIIPGAFNTLPDAPIAAGCGLLFAAMVSYFKGGMIFSVVGGILVTYVYLLFI